MSLIVTCGSCSRTFRVRQDPGDRQVPCGVCGKPLEFSSLGPGSSLLQFLPLLMWGGLTTMLVGGATGITAFWFSQSGDFSQGGDSLGQEVTESVEQQEMANGASLAPDEQFTIPSVGKVTYSEPDRTNGPKGSTHLEGRVFAVAPVLLHEVRELREIRVPSPISLAGTTGRVIQYSLAAPPPAGVRVSTRTGELIWRPSEDQGPGEYTIVLAARVGSPVSEQIVRVRIRVLEVNTPPDLGSRAGSPVHRVPIGEVYIADMGGAQDRDRPRNQLEYRLTGAVPKNASINGRTGEFRWEPPEFLLGQTLPLTVVVTDNGEPPLSSRVQYRLQIVRSLNRSGSSPRTVPRPTRVTGSSKTNASRPSATRPVAGKTSAGGKSTARNPGTKAAATGADACKLCSGNGINACPIRACKNGFQKINGNKYPCSDCLGLGKIPCRTCPDLRQKRAESAATINVAKGHSRNMQGLASRTRVVLTSINSLSARNQYIDRKLDDDETRLSEVRDLAREKTLNEGKILRLKSELPGLRRSFFLAKTGLSRSVQRQAVLLSDGQSNGFQFSIKKRLRDLTTFINSL